MTAAIPHTRGMFKNWSNEYSARIKSVFLPILNLKLTSNWYTYHFSEGSHITCIWIGFDNSHIRNFKQSLSPIHIPHGLKPKLQHIRLWIPVSFNLFMKSRFFEEMCSSSWQFWKLSQVTRKLYFKVKKTL